MDDLPEKLEFKSTFLNKEEEETPPVEKIMNENPTVPISDLAILLSKSMSTELAKMSGCNTRVEQSIVLVKQVSERKFVSELTKYTFMSFIYTDLKNLAFWSLQPFDYVFNGATKIEQKAYRMLIFDPLRHEQPGDEKFKKDLSFLHKFFEKYIRGQTVKEGQQVQFGLLLRAIKEGLESPGKQLYFDLEIPDKDARWIFQLNGNELFVYFSKTAAPNIILEPAQMSPWISSIHPYFAQMHHSHFYVALTPENIEAILHENLDEYTVNDGLYEARPQSPTSVKDIDE